MPSPLIQAAPALYFQPASIVSIHEGQNGALIVDLDRPDYRSREIKLKEADSITLGEPFADEFRETWMAEQLRAGELVAVMANHWVVLSKITEVTVWDRPDNPSFKFALAGPHSMHLQPESSKGYFDAPFWDLFEKITGHTRPEGAKPTNYDPLPIDQGKFDRVKADFARITRESGEMIFEDHAFWFYGSKDAVKRLLEHYRGGQDGAGRSLTAGSGEHFFRLRVPSFMGRIDRQKVEVPAAPLPQPRRADDGLGGRGR
ncbi:hypothetical protein [Oleiharenicola sp. Vm1]|uniref:hypothetical protein n=1 Tax=Oleiharenicola sp. Vm1 TaxID=3398393 RepID=UPI0039F59E21